MAHISIKAEEIFHLGNFPLTNALLLAGVVFLALVFLGLILRRRFAIVPGAFQNLAEIVIGGMLDVMDSVLGDRRVSEKYLPLVATIFIFILMSNWFGLIPGVGSLGISSDHEFVPFLRSPASDLNFTLALGLIAVIMVNVFGSIALGVKRYAGKFFNFSGPIQFFVGILELVSEFAKIISFSFRLFGNVFAGEVLLLIIAFLVPYVVPLPFLFLEIFVGFIQAFVFAMLTLVFIAISTSESEAHAH